LLCSVGGDLLTQSRRPFCVFHSLFCALGVCLCVLCVMLFDDVVFRCPLYLVHVSVLHVPFVLVYASDYVVKCSVLWFLFPFSIFSFPMVSSQRRGVCIVCCICSRAQSVFVYSFYVFCRPCSEMHWSYFVLRCPLNVVCFMFPDPPRSTQIHTDPPS